MDTEIIRFKVDPALRGAAAKVCAGLGLELNDVLRTVVTRIAQDGALPFDLDRRAPRFEPLPGPFQRYGPRLWSAVKPPIDSRVVLVLLARFIADCSDKLDQLSHAGTPDKAVIDRLTLDRAAARDLRRSLDVNDAQAVAQVIATYGPLVRTRPE